MIRNALPVLIAAIAFTLPAFSGDDKLDLQKGDHVAIIGEGYADRLQHDGWLETLLQKAYPKHELVIRNLAFSGDEIVSKVQTDTGATREQWLANIKADVILAFYGFNESFAGPDGLPKFKEDLDKFLKEKLKANYSGKGAPKLVLFSPLAHEKINDPNIPDSTENNKNLTLYTAAMAEVAKANGVKFVDLFAESQKLYSAAQTPLTFNGVHMTEAGNRVLAPVIFKAAIAAELPAQSADIEKLRAVVVDKSETWHDRYRTVDSFNIFGGRSNLSYESGKGGPKVSNAEVMRQEMGVRDVMTANRDKVVWTVAQGGDAKPDDTNLPPVKEVKTNLWGANPDGSHPFLSGEEAISKMTLAKGCKITLFASEEQFPELVQPVQMAWDTKGRLWVASWKNYPERTPTSKDGDKLLIFEDTNGDGKADKCTTFVDNLNCPTGFTFYKDGVLVMRSPDLLWLRDTNGDDKADWSERVLMGLDAADSHHETNSMVRDPGGATYLSDGVFHRTQVETAAGPVRNTDGCIYRYEPLTHRFERYVPYGFANPHGRVFDYWGTDIITDATGNSNYFAPAFSGMIDFPHKHPGLQEFWKRPSRPCPGTAFLSSRHFPDDMNGNFLNCNVIGMQGIFRVKVTEDGSGIKGETLEHLLMSSDKNFRPTGCSVAPDGSLYIMDWTNAIIGHMQHHLRDPNRDHVHGRIYRMTYEGRALLTPPKVDGEPIEKLLNILKEPEDNLRLRAKLELDKHPSKDVIAAVDKWAAGLDKNEPTYEHNMLEALWLHQWHNVVDIPLLKRELRSPDHHARAAATRVLCYWRDRVPEALTLLKAQAEDEHARVRIEAVRAASFFSGKDVPAAFDIAFTALKQPVDYYIDYCYRETIKQLKMHGTEPVPADPELAALVAKQAKAPPPGEEKKYGPTRKNLTKAELKTYDLGKAVFNRDAHCVTCHQPNGLGLAPIYPPLTNKDWLAGDDERLIKIVLKGLWGPLEVNGKRFDPTKGTPPMTGFADLLKDEEIAAVLTYVRQSFGNDYDPIKPDAVKKIRAMVESRNSFYQIEDLMKENPMAGWEKWKDAPAKTAKSHEEELAPFVDTLAGGDGAAGKKLFFESEKVQCAKCHKINGKGADVGPDLSKLAAQEGKDKKYFLESLIVPSAQIAKGYDVHMAKLNDGKIFMGILKAEDDKKLSLMQADGKLIEVPKDQIKTRVVQKESAMPPMGEVLTKQEIRNVIEFLSTLK
jgi:putative heme-binding domain-containing protein